MSLPRLLRWILLTLVVIVAVGVMIRLGFWQLDRLAQRRSFNASVRANQSMPALDLNLEQDVSGLETMAYRPTIVRGEYLFDEQLMLRNQVENGLTGIHLLTPLKLSGSSSAVLVDRGWIPLEDATRERIRKYDQPGEVQVHGVLRTGRTGLKTRSQDIVGGKLIAVNVMDMQAITAQSSVPLLPVYIQEAPQGAGGENLPIGSVPELDLSEGPHASYALQWFAFAAILAGGYPYYVYKHFRQSSSSSRRLPDNRVNQSLTRH